MKKKISVVLAVIFALGAFALLGCTDKPRELDSVEKSIVGTWEWRLHDDITITFNSDGTRTHSNGNKGTFKHNGDGVDATLGHYEIIHDGWRDFLALFDVDPDRLYSITSDGIIQLTGYYERQQ